VSDAIDRIAGIAAETAEITETTVGKDRWTRLADQRQRRANRQ
jgi:hypothetical protein